ncbi:hypothetical protein [Hyphomonas sp.]|jgi:hypothetical protein|uniref:hypothetical protein n=1 Tax=Hyphomonas sp. TaxID=87 RepID=UPI0025BD8C03|nr:hypothetical protein [Hyphomonas sp.]|tara:strand:- start:148 stop:504 length:357 start_codon:yes stop_codon:yes gene_type:complete
MIWLKLLNNPLTKIIADKTIGAISHKLKKDAIVKQKELDAASQISIEQIKQQEHSWKDEWLVVFFTILMAAHFIPYTQDTMARGWEILQNADPMFWYIILTIVGASFGVTTMNKLKKK